MISHFIARIAEHKNDFLCSSCYTSQADSKSVSAEDREDYTNFLSAKLVSDVCRNLINICVVTLNSCYDGFCNTNNVSVANYKFSCLFSTENHISNDFFQVISFSDDWSPQAS